MGRPVFVCTDRAPAVPDDSDCPNNAQHEPHPRGYIAHCAWAEAATLVADQHQCPGCGLWKIWTPKAPTVRIAVAWPPSNCHWGGCHQEVVAERYAAEMDAWLPVCAEHVEAS